MRRATSVSVAGNWPSDQAEGQVTLDFDSRRRRRIRLDCGAAGPVLLDLPETATLSDGAGLHLTDGGWVEVRAAPEELVLIRCEDPRFLARVAWHLGNHHCPAELAADRIWIRRDHVIEDMLRGLGCKTVQVNRPFNPEPGAYQRGAHDHGHS